ncbi:MAG: nucleotidyl transferase AbiEii/AbiGii toxin family protein [Planctomycetes bacterium]|nr:nucleotidyl transferase AbiEii/AbiGii toxin family protein [Planctomycetota bacterium]
MEVQPDFRDLLVLFRKHEVEYLIVGGYALAFHGAPRFTGDIDLLVRPDAENARRILAALADFGFESSDLSADDFQETEHVIQLGVPPVRIDLLTSISGVTWVEAEAGKAAGEYGDVSVYYLGREAFVANKRASGRQKDLADLEALGEG